MTAPAGTVTNAAPHSESARQWVHMGSGGFAFLLRVLSWPQAAALAVAALAFNASVLPRIGGRRLYREADRARGFPFGILLYPFSVLLLVLVFRSRLDIAAAAWGVLAFGDGAATLVGRRLGRRPLGWNREKTAAGTVAFALCGGAAAVVLAWWTGPAIQPPPPAWFAVAGPAVAATAAALVESIPARLDDNLSVPLAAGAALWIVSLADPSALAASGPALAAALPWAVGINLIVAWLGYRARTVSVSGAVGGAAVGIVIYAGAGPGGWLLLFASFLAASIASRIGLRRKTSLGIAEERGGRRGAGNAFANCGVAAVAAAVCVATPYAPAALVALAAALTAGGSDTVASEAGKAWGRSTFLVTSLARVAPGTPGAVSLEGTAAGAGAAFALAGLAAALGIVNVPAVVPIVVGATAGALVESALGATLERPGILNNDMLNFINTAVAAGVALALAG